MADLRDWPVYPGVEDRRNTEARPEDGAWDVAAAERWRNHNATRTALHQPRRDRLGALLKLIRDAEAGGSYDAFYSLRNPAHKPLSSMSVAEVRAYQEGAARFGAKSTAAGAYQIIRSTLDELVHGANLDTSRPFDKHMQDGFAYRLIIRRGLIRWQEGGDWRIFAHALSKEWASLPNVVGEKHDGPANPAASYWGGHAGNKALVSVDEIAEILA